MNENLLLDENKVKKFCKRTCKRQELTEKKVKSMLLSMLQVKNLFQSNADKKFTNAEVAQKLKLSTTTVSEITNLLEAKGEIKIVAVKQGVSSVSQVFQYKTTKRPSVPKDRLKPSLIYSLIRIFRNNENQEFSKEELADLLNVKSDRIMKSLHLLLLDGDIKITSIEKGTEYQSCNGNKKGFNIRHLENAGEYKFLREYLEENDLNKFRVKFMQELSTKNMRLFYSSIGLIKEFPIKDLEAAKKKCLKKSRNIFSRIFGKI